MPFARHLTARISPIEEEPEDPSTHEQNQLPSNSTMKICNICHPDGATDKESREQPPTCNPQLHIIYKDFPLRYPTIVKLIQQYGPDTLKIYRHINICKEMSRTEPQHENHPLQITIENLQLVEFAASANSAAITFLPEGQNLGRTTSNSLYYPHMLDEHINRYIPNFNKLRPIQDAIQFHPWIEAKPAWLNPASNELRNTSWKEFRLISFNTWLTVPALIDRSGETYVDVSLLQYIADNRGAQLPTNLPGLLTIYYVEYIPGRELETIKNLYKTYFPNLWSIGNPIGPLIPLATFARGIEILECLLAARAKIQLFTPITGSVIILGQVVPFIMIAGKVHIPYSIVKLIIPHPPPQSEFPQSNLLVTQVPPIQLYNWLLTHLIVAAQISEFKLKINPVIPIDSLFQVDGISLHWWHLRSKAKLSQAISKLKNNE